MLMFGTPSTTVLQLSTLALLLSIAVATDVRSRRIPNGLVLVGTAAALTMHATWLASGQDALAGAFWWSPLAGLAVGFALLLPIHLLRAMGAGDVKLMAMVGAFVGPYTVLAVTLYTFLAGGVLALAFMVASGVAAQTFANLRFMLCDLGIRVLTRQGMQVTPPLTTTAARLPYALAIAVGTGAALIWPLGS